MQRPAKRHRRLHEKLVTLILMVQFGFFTTEVTGQSPETTYRFNVPSQPADQALTELAQQADVSAGFYLYDEVHAVITNEVIGEYTLDEALQRMIAGTDLRAEVTAHGVLVARLRPEPPEGDSLPAEPGMRDVEPTDGTADTQVGPEVERAPTIEEIMVTSRRRAESLQDTPIAVTALTAQRMRSMGISNSRDLGLYVPNMQAMSQGGLGGNFQYNITIRGIGADREYPDTEQSVGVYINDVFFPRSAGNVIDMVELERVEVLRGPQGTLFGRNSMSGTIRYVTKMPSNRFAGRVETKVGSLNRVDLSGSVEFPISDAWSGILSFGTDSRDGFVTHDADSQSSGSKDVSQFRSALRYSAGALIVDIAYTDIENRNDGPPRYIFDVCPTCAPFAVAVENNPGGPYDNRYASRKLFTIHGGSIDPNFLRLDQSTIETTVTYNISSDLTFKAVTADTELEYVWSQDIDGSPLPVYDASFGESNESFQQEFQLSGDFDRNSFVAGLFYFKDRPHFNQFTRNAAQGKRVRDQYYGTDAQALYAQSTYRVSDMVSFTGGIRYTREEKRLRSIFTQHEDPNIQGLSAGNSKSWSGTTGHLNLEIRPSEYLLVYGSASEGFKSGGINFNLDTSPIPAPNYGILPFDPEKAISYELGLKWNSSDNGTILNAAAFYMSLKNQQLGALRKGPTGFIGLQVNAGKLHTSGLEIDMQTLVTEHFQLRATAAVFDGKYDDIGAAGATGLFSLDSELALSPKWSFSVGGRLMKSFADGASVNIDVDYSWRDDMQAQTNSLNNRTLESVGLLSAGIEYLFPGERLSMTIRGSNLTDESYFTHVRLFDNGAPFGQSSADLGRPRELYVSTAFRF